MGSSLFRPFENLVEIQVLGRTFQVPEKNTLLRALQFLDPAGVSYGRFCWNQECQFCRVSYVMKSREEKPPREILACKSPCENTTLILLAIEISVPWRSVLPGR